MAEKLVTAVEVQASVTGDGSVKTLRQELRDAVQDAAELAGKFGEASPQATEAAKRVANLRDRMEDLNNRVKALNPDKFQRFATFASGIANGFQAAQGAMALFGAESEDVQKQLVRIQGAIAFAQGIQGVKDFAQSFSGLGGVIKTQVVTAFSTLKGAIAATGIGALIVGVGVLIGYFENLASAAEKAANAEEEALNKRAEFENKVLELDMQDLERQEKLAVSKAKATRATEEEIFDIEQSFRNKKAEKLKTYRDALQKDTMEYMKANKAYQAAIAEIEIADNLRQEQINKQQDERAAAAREREAQRRAEAEKNRDNEILNFQRDQERVQEAEALSDKAQKIIEQRGELNRKRREKERAEELAAEQAAAQARLDVANSTAQGLSAIADIIATAGGKATAAQKAAALAQIGIDTASAISSMLKGVEAASAATGPAYPVTKVALYATGIATILSNVARAKALLSQSSASGVAAAGAGAFSSAPPQAGARTFTGFGLPSDQIETAGGAQQMRVYVVDSDITRQQKRSRAIQRTSVI